jgi:hypothetical protein
MIRRSASNHFLKVLPGPFETILQGLNTDKQAIIVAVKKLLRPSRRNQANAINDEDS